MVAAFAWSGGGITAILCTMCAQHMLDYSIIKDDFQSSVQSTVSGGSVGHALYGETQNRILAHNLTLRA